MGPEMLSGPDLGGGYLFQLTRDGTSDRTTFTYHAQDGSEDAGGPPPGPPEPFGFRRADGYCAFGGRICWHREMEAPAASALAVRNAYNRLRFVMAPMLAQQYSHRAVPIETGLSKLLDAVGPRLAADQIPWAVGGSSSAWLRGAAVAPHDLDVVTTRTGVRTVGEALAESLTEPPSLAEWGRSTRVVGLRAFVGTLTDGVRLECAEEETAPGPARLSEWRVTDPAAGISAVRWNEREVPVTAIEFAIARFARKGQTDRLDAVSQVPSIGPVNSSLLRALLPDAPRRPELARWL